MGLNFKRWKNNHQFYNYLNSKIVILKEEKRNKSIIIIIIIIIIGEVERNSN